MFGYSSIHMLPGLFLRQSALKPQISFWWTFVEQPESRYAMMIDARLMKYISARIRLSLEINVIQRCRKSLIGTWSFVLGAT